MPRTPNGRLGQFSIWVCTGSVALDVRSLDDRPPFLDVGLLPSCEGVRRLLLDRKNLLPNIGQSLAYLRIAQRFNDGGIELRDDVLRGMCRHPEAVPKRHVEPRYSRLVDGGNVGSPYPVVL